jgi:protein SCO1/2
MKNPTRTLARFGALGLAALLFAACSSGPAQPPASLGNVTDRTISSQIASIPLTDQNGATLTIGGFKSKTLLIVPFLTLCPDVCPFTTGNLLAVQASIDAAKQQKDVAILELSVDPERDTPARLAAYAKNVGATWTMAVASAADTMTLMKYFGMTTEKMDAESGSGVVDWMTGQPLTYDLSHSDGFSVINTAGVERFVSGATPAFHGTLPSVLDNFLSEDGKATKADPPKNGWTPADALGAISWVSGTTIPLAAR